MKDCKGDEDMVSSDWHRLSRYCKEGGVLRLFSAAVGAFVLLGATPAWANGRFPASNQIVFSPSDQNLIILRTSYGILPSHDNGATWQFLCEDAVGLPATTPLDPELGLTQTNALVAGVTNEFRMGA